MSNDSRTTSLYNYPVQGTGADGFKYALGLMDNKLKDMDARIVQVMHDEVILEVKNEIAEDVAVIVKDCMEGAFSKLIPNVPFKVEPEIRDTWG